MSPKVEHEDDNDRPVRNLRRSTRLIHQSTQNLAEELSILDDHKIMTTPTKRKKVLKDSRFSSPSSISSKLSGLKISSPAKRVNNSTSTKQKIKNENIAIKENLLLASKKLHSSAIPDILVGREAEQSQIETFVQSQLTSLTGGCLYVSGVPGTGKTASVSTVIHKLQRKNATRLKLLEVNCMNITEPKQIYTFIHKALFGKKVSPKTALEVLTQHFSFSKQQKWPKLFLVLDEMDLLWTRRQDVLYNMFDWPSHSSLAVIAISNTLDLPERLLSHRVASRLGPNRICFKPYIFTELKSIIDQRVRALDVFEDEAVEFASRKVSSVSGDARSILSVCRRLIEVRLGSAEAFEGKIGIREMDEIFREVHSSPKIAAIRNLSALEKLLVSTLMNCQRSLSVDQVPVNELYSRFTDCVRSEGYHFGASHSHFMGILLALAGSYLVCVEDTRHGSCKLVASLNVSFDDVLLALV